MPAALWIDSGIEAALGVVGATVDCICSLAAADQSHRLDLSDSTSPASFWTTARLADDFMGDRDDLISDAQRPRIWSASAARGKARSIGCGANGR